MGEADLSQINVNFRFHLGQAGIFVLIVATRMLKIARCTL